MYKPVENRMAVEGQQMYEERYGSLDWEYFRDEYDDIRTICDVCDCDDRPRMGDDCDGRDDEEEDDDDDRIAYYERQGDEYVYYDEDEHELFREPV